MSSTVLSEERFITVYDSRNNSLWKIRYYHDDPATVKLTSRIHEIYYWSDNGPALNLLTGTKNELLQLTDAPRVFYIDNGQPVNLVVEPAAGDNRNMYSVSTDGPSLSSYCEPIASKRVNGMMIELRDHLPSAPAPAPRIIQNNPGALRLRIITGQAVDQSWSIERIGREAQPPSWESVFENATAELKDVSDILDEQERLRGQYYPLKKDIFNAFHLTPLSSVKVVILGMDPYHQTIPSPQGGTVPRAIGTSFSVRPYDSIPSSLQNIYTELENSVKGFIKPDHGDLTEWCRQGVLMVNACLTVYPGEAGSHGEIWLGFMSKVFSAIARANPNCIYLLWGRNAQGVKPMLGERSVVLEAAHPSGFSARRGFFGCNHFNEVNRILLQQGKVGINWRITPRNGQPLPAAPPMAQPAAVPRSNLVPVSMNNLQTLLPPAIPAGIPGPRVPGPTLSLPIVPNVLQTNTKEPLQPQDIPTEPVIRKTNTTVPDHTIAPGVPIIPKVNFGTALTYTPAVTIPEKTPLPPGTPPPQVRTTIPHITPIVY